MKERKEEEGICYRVFQSLGQICNWHLYSFYSEYIFPSILYFYPFSVFFALLRGQKNWERKSIIGETIHSRRTDVQCSSVAKTALAQG
jgi:hypothetical protein